MADNRLTVDNNEVGGVFATFAIDDSTIVFNRDVDGYAGDGSGNSVVGLAVTLASDNTIELTGDGEFVLGRLVSVSPHGYATVQVGGFMKLPSGDSAPLTVGKQIVGDLGAASAEGYVREVDDTLTTELEVARGFLATDAADSDGNVDVWL